jgi:hypothetical protein
MLTSNHQSEQSKLKISAAEKVENLFRKVQKMMEIMLLQKRSLLSKRRAGQFFTSDACARCPAVPVCLPAEETIKITELVALFSCCG